MSEVAYPRLWLTVGAGWVALVVFLSVGTLNLPQLPSTFGDKINHALAYGFMMGWFGQLIRRGAGWWVIALALVTLGALMEALQSLLPYRWFELTDAAANAIGILAGLALLYAGADRILLSVERWAIAIKR